MFSTSSTQSKWRNTSFRRKSTRRPKRSSRFHRCSSPDQGRDIPVVAQKQISMILTVQKSIEISQLQVDDKVVDVPVVLVVQTPLVQVIAKTAEIPQLQITDKVVDVPVVLVMPVPQVRVVKKTVEDPQFEIVEKTVENPETHKICDQISDVVIDACLTCDAKCMVACETCVKDNMFMAAGEITVAGKMDDFDDTCP